MLLISCSFTMFTFREFISFQYRQLQLPYFLKQIAILVATRLQWFDYQYGTKFITKILQRIVPVLKIAPLLLFNFCFCSLFPIFISQPGKYSLINLFTWCLIIWLALQYMILFLQEAHKQSSNWLPPPWAIVAMVVLGFNEFMLLLK